ncbi:MAG: potassium-transporting ATPase subunit KdpA [Acidimicrobiales bacterium]
MSVAAIVSLAATIVVLWILVPITGRYLAAVYGDDRAPGDRVFAPVERAVYRVCGIDASSEQRWTGYLRSLLAFSIVGFGVLYLLLRFQGTLPGNPADLGAVPAALAFNTTVSFVTNTNWQAYGGETTLSHLTQMLGLTVQNFVSAAAGMAVAVAIIRGVTRERSATVGNFWVDLTRTITRVLVPMAVVGAVLLVVTGVVQNLSGHTTVATLEGAVQQIPGGPAASQVAIKQLGTNGGGFFNVNSAHPLENPSPWSNSIEMVMILLIPLAFPIAYGRMVGDRRQGRVLLGVMVGILFAATSVAALAESAGNPALTAVGVDQSISAGQGGGNLEGKEVRFGAAASGYWAAATTNTSNGSVNAMHDSFTPLGGGVALLSMLLGEVSPGGVGVGFMGLFVYALLAVFVAGLMVGRTPEYLGKKIQAAEMKLIVLYLLAMPVIVLSLAAVSVVWGSARESIPNPGAHGLTEVLYAFGSGGNNNGSAFAGFGADTPWFNGAIGVAMLVGRFFLIIPAVALAGSLAAKPKVPESAGTFPTHGPLFGGLVVGVVLIIAGLTFFPALALGPIVEQLSI